MTNVYVSTMFAKADILIFLTIARKSCVRNYYLLAFLLLLPAYYRRLSHVVLVFSVWNYSWHILLCSCYCVVEVVVLRWALFFRVTQTSARNPSSQLHTRYQACRAMSVHTQTHRMFFRFLPFRSFCCRILIFLIEFRIMTCNQWSR